MWCDKILRALVHLATTNSSRFFAIATTRALGLQVLATWRIVNRFMDTLSRTWNSFSCMFSPRGVKELTKRNFKEMLTKWYVRRAMLCQKKKKLCHLSHIIEFFRLRYCVEPFLTQLGPAWTDQKFFFFYNDCIISIEILIALWSVQ